MGGKSVLFISVPNLIIELKEAMSRSQLTAYKRKFERFDRWEEIFKDAMLTGAMVDRLAYKAHILDLSREVSHRYEETVSWKNSKNM